MLQRHDIWKQIEHSQEGPGLYGEIPRCRLWEWQTSAGRGQPYSGGGQRREAKVAMTLMCINCRHSSTNNILSLYSAMTSSAPNNKVLSQLINFLSQTPCREKVVLVLFSAVDSSSISPGTSPRDIPSSISCNLTSGTSCLAKSRKPIHWLAACPLLEKYWGLVLRLRRLRQSSSMWWNS